MMETPAVKTERITDRETYYVHIKPEPITERETSVDIEPKPVRDTEIFANTSSGPDTDRETHVCIKPEPGSGIEKFVDTLSEPGPERKTHTDQNAKYEPVTKTERPVDVTAEPAMCNGTAEISSRDASGGEGGFVIKMEPESDTDVEKETVVKTKPPDSFVVKCRKTKPEGKPFRCTRCDATFSRSGYLRKHMSSCSGVKSFSCKECSECFYQSRDLREHEKLHMEVHIFSCKECDATFVQSKDFKDHLSTHAFPFACCECDSRFGTSTELESHGQIHSGQGLFSCHLCNITCRSFRSLTAHVKGHTGGKTHSCKVCGTTFTTAHQVKVHLRIHTGEKPFPCRECGVTFTQACNLKRHIHRKHCPASEPAALAASNTPCPQSSAAGTVTTPDLMTATCKLGVKEGGNIIADIISEAGTERAAVAGCLGDPASPSLSDSEERGPSATPDCGSGKFMYVDLSLVAPAPAADKEAGKDVSRVALVGVAGSDAPADVQPPAGRGGGRGERKTATEDRPAADSEFVIKMEPLSESDTDMETEGTAENEVPTVTGREGACSSASEGDTDSPAASCTPSFSRSDLDAAPKPAARNTLRPKQVITGETERPFRCRECGATFKQSGHFNAHKKIHTGEKPYVCTECDALFRERSHLRKHAIIHTGEKPFACKECGDTFARPGQLKSHTFRKHFSGKTRSCRCPDCPAAFFAGSDLKRHRLIHTGEKPFVCSDCSSAFKTVNELNAHRRIHTGEKPHMCDECSASFAQSSQLKKHKLSKHSSLGIRPYPCPDCCSAFVTRFDLVNHRRTHTGEKPFKCRNCAALFSQASALKMHMQRKHSPGIPRPFPCPGCSAAFFTPSDLKEHQRVHAGGRQSV